MTADEVPEEPATITEENFLQLSCFISMEVKYMQSGLKSVIIIFVHCCPNKYDFFIILNVENERATCEEF